MAAKMAPGETVSSAQRCCSGSRFAPLLLLTGDASELCDFVGNLAHVYCVLIPRQ
jgi:hypothetical protein